MKNILIILFSFLLSKSLEFSNLRILNGDGVKENALIIYELRFERNDLVMKASNKTDNLKNETNATLYFRNHDKKRKNIQCRFNNSNSDGYFLIYCNITTNIFSNFSNSNISLPNNNNKTMEICFEDSCYKYYKENLTYNYEYLKLLALGNYDKNNNFLLAFFNKPKSDYETKKYLFFGANIKTEKTQKNYDLDGILQSSPFSDIIYYNIGLYNIFQNEVIDKFETKSVYCLTNNETDNITYCDSAKIYNEDIDFNSKIYVFSNSEILNQKESPIKIQGEYPQDLNLQSGSKDIQLRFYRHNGTQENKENISCSLKADNTKHSYEMSCINSLNIPINILGARINITDLINNGQNLRILDDNGGNAFAIINGEEEKLSANYVSYTKSKFSGGIIATIVIVSVGLVALVIISAVLLTRSNFVQKNNMPIDMNSSYNNNQK
jgi:hypothetical protein